jgi:hypothetical protein
MPTTPRGAVTYPDDSILATVQSVTDPIVDITTKFVLLGDSDDDLEQVVSLLVDKSTRRINYAYDGSNRVSTVTVRNAGNTTTYLTMTYAYNADGTVDTVTTVFGSPAVTITKTYAYAGGLVSAVTTTVS